MTESVTRFTRNIKWKYLFIFIITTILFGCEDRSKDRPHISAAGWAVLRAIRVENAVKDAKSALSEGDCRIYSVGGVIDFGRVLDHDELNIANQYKIIEIEGTGDIPYDREYNMLNIRAANYAKKYNETIINMGKCPYSATSREAIHK